MGTVRVSQLVPRETDSFDPERVREAEDRFRSVLTPDEVVAALVADDRSTLVEIGAGPGFFTLPAARMLTGGRVFALDAVQGYLDLLRRRASREGLGNVTMLHIGGTELPLEDGVADAVLVTRVFRDIPHWLSLRREVPRILRPGGRLCVMEWAEGVALQGPKLNIWVDPDELAQIVEQSGFHVTDVLKEPKPFFRILATRNRVTPPEVREA